MFNEVCRQIVGKSSLEVKKTILDFKGSDEKIEVEDPTIQDLVDLLHLYDVKTEFSLKASFTDFQVKDTAGEKPFCETHKKIIQDEKKAIVNPDLRQTVDQSEAPVFISTPAQINNKIDATKIEDFLQ